MKKVVTLCSIMMALIATRPAWAQETGGTLLFRVSGNSLVEPSYIFGTHHFASITVLDSYEGFAAAFDSAEVVAGELLMSDMGELQAALAPHMMMPEGYSYASMLSGDEYKAVDGMLRELMDVGLDVLSGMHPAGIQTMFTSAFYGRVVPGFNPATHLSLDQYLQNLATAQGKKCIGLENVSDQVDALFYSEPVEEKAKSLAVMASNMEYYQRSMKKLNDYYENKDLEGLYDISFHDPEDPNPMSEEYAYSLNKERNDRWLAKLPGLMEQNSCFVAVGALHLAGADGLLENLKKMGYNIEPVK